MSRPQIIRADTLDLQDKTSPTAQDHTRQPSHPAPLGIGPAAPHQAAAIHHVQVERASEEEQLRHAWNNDARADPPSDDEQDIQNATNGDAAYYDQNGQHDGTHNGQAEDQEMGDAESDEEDMMDKISSSPSIDDGGYSSHLAATQGISTPQTDRHRPSTAPSPGLSVGSSPFVSTPQHFPLGDAHRWPTSLATPESLASSPYAATPVYSPISSPGGGSVHSIRVEEDVDGNLRGEYSGTSSATRPLRNDPADSPSPARPKTADRLAVPPSLERDVSVQSLNEEAMDRLLLPADDPALCEDAKMEEEQGDDDAITDLTDPDEQGWETESDPSSFDSDDYREDLANDISYDPSTKDSRFVDSGWGGECLQETEDIDFEFVYALHTFVATVEGQANATKGDTMVLLDDSNSYWWLVRIVKDSSIGYLPAEHIETPTERLARLNKHRNIDLSATMLGDTAEKSKNPLKKAMRRRNARTVQFSTQPIYVEASDYEFSSDDEDGDDSMFGNGPQNGQGQQSAYDVSVGHSDESETVVTERDGPESTENGVQLNGRTDEVESRGRGGDQPRPSEDSVIDKQFGPGRSRNGTVRNTDSFFRDETVETRKITLTPNILRDESLGAATNVRPQETRERGASFDSIGRSESSKEDKKRKEKKPGMFSGLFKKKDKKGKGSDDMDDLQPGALSPKLSEDSSPMSPTPGQFPANAQQGPQRAGSRGKLQKAPPKADGSPNLAQPASNEQPGLGIQKQPSPQPEQVASDHTGVSGPAQQQSMRMVQSSDEELRKEQPPSLRIKTEQPEAEPQQHSTRSSGSLMSSFIDTLRSPDDGQPKREKVRKAKQRMELDDFDSSPEEEKAADPFADAHEYRNQSQQQAGRGPSERLSESPVQVSPVGHTRSLDTEDSQPPGLVGDTSSQEDHHSSPASSPEFEDVGTEFKQQPHDTPMQPDTRSFSPGNGAAPAPLSIRKQSSVQSMDQGHYVPPQPTRAAPTPGLDRSASPAVRQVSGARSVTPTSALAKQSSFSHLNPQQQHQVPSSSPTSTSDSSVTPTAPSTTTAPPKTPPAHAKPEPQWSDAALRAYMDDTSHVHNLLMIVHDTSGVVPLGPEDPKVQAWFPEERKTLGRLERDLDHLLQGWVQRKTQSRGKSLKS